MNRLNTIDVSSIDKSKVFIEVTSPGWRFPAKISLQQLINDPIVYEKPVFEPVFIQPEKYDITKDIDFKTIILDPVTLKLKVDDSLLNTSNVNHEFLSNDNGPILNAPKDALDNSKFRLMSDSNYLYVWNGKKWKRILLSDWED